MSSSLAVQKKGERAAQRRRRVRARIVGTSQRPRLAVFRSLRHISAQIIDDEKGVTLVAASDTEAKAAGAGMERAQAVGTLVGEKALKKNITAVVFDRHGYKYHGQVKALAEAVRKAGLKL